MFPVTTIINHQLYPLRQLDGQFGAQLTELAKQGWTSRDIVWLDLSKVKVKHIGSRRVGDRYALVMPLHPILDRKGQAPDSTLEYAEFTVCDEKPRPLHPTPRSRSRSTPMYIPPRYSEELSIRVQELSSLALYYSYTTSQGYSINDWRGFVEKRLERWLATEQYKDPSSIHPPPSSLFGPQFSPPRSRSELPAGWDYADDQMPVWYRQWEEERRADV